MVQLIRKAKYVFSFVLLFFPVTLTSLYAYQEATPLNEAPALATDSTSVSGLQNIRLTELQDFHSLWQLTELGGQIRWGIFFVFGLAVLFIIKKILELSFDVLHSRRLAGLNLETATINDVRDAMRESKSCMLARLVAKQFDLFQSSGKADSLHEELQSFMSLQREQFSRFSNRMNFLADTAGALGLLGTVWGMFITFFGGNLDSQRILNGMGIALITTLLGLVVSILINFASTEVTNFFNRRIERVFAFADLVRMRFFFSRHRENSVPHRTEVVASDRTQVRASELRLRSVSELEQKAAVGRHLPKPLAVQTVDANGIPVNGVEVVFEVIGNGGYFVDKQTQFKVATNKKGQAEASFLLDGEIGDRSVVAYLDGNSDSRLEFQIQGVAGPPAKLAALEGNHQTAKVGQLLAKPFVLSLTDAFGNPVTDYPIIFTVTKGAGRFANYNPDFEAKTNGLRGIFKRKFLSQKISYETKTDADGTAEARLVLGPIPGVNEVTATAKGVSKSPIIFAAMAQPAEELAG